MKGETTPVQGVKSDPAHPAIHPTGEIPRGSLGHIEDEVFDLIARRFLAAFGPPASRELASARISVGGHEFRLSGEKTLYRGWMDAYGRYAEFSDRKAPDVAEGDRLKVVGIDAEEKFEEGPQRYNHGSLLERMERENIGTKSTRAEVISTIEERGYVEGGSMTVTDLGLSVIEAMERYAPSVLSTKLTREVERRMEEIERGDKGGSELVRETVRSVAEQALGLSENEQVVGAELGTAVAYAAASVLGPCPVCRSGQLRVIRSRKTRKRFVGCSNYAKGCRASAPLPQRGGVKATPSGCPRCSWPVVQVTGGRRPWRLCVNPACPLKRRKT